MNYKELAHNKVLAARRIELFVLNKRFENAWKNASSVEREGILRAIKECNENMLKIIFRDIKRDIEALTYNELIELAKNHHVPNWSRLEKDDLILELQAIGVK